jgi:hypothetical protein
VCVCACVSELMRDFRSETQIMSGMNAEASRERVVENNNILHL